MSVTITDLQALNFAFELTASLFPSANVYLARQKTSSSSTLTYLAAVVDSVWRDKDDTSKGVKRRLVVGIQTGETRVLALNKLVEKLEDVARERIEKILEEGEIDEEMDEEDEEEEEESEEEEKGQPQMVVGVQEKKAVKTNPVEKATQKSSTAAVAPVETGRQTRASDKATKASANNNTTPAPVITTSKNKNTVAVPDSDSSSLSELDDLIETPETEAVQPKKAVASQQAAGSKKTVAPKKQAKPKKGRQKLMVVPEHPFGKTSVEDTTKKDGEGSRLRGKGKR